MSQQGVTIKVGLAGAATTRREAEGTGRSIHKLGDEAEHAGHKFKLAEASSKSWEKSSEKLKDVVRDLAGVTGLAGLAFGTGEIVKSAVDAQNAQIKLRQTLKNAGLSWRKYGRDVQEANDKTAMRTGFSPAQITESMTNLIRTTHDVGKAQSLNNTVLDLARTKNMGLAGASSLVARVYAGNYKGLNRLGLQVTQITTEQDALRDSGRKYTVAQLARAKADDAATTKATALLQLQKAFHGQATKFANGTLQGQVDRLKSSLEVIQNDVGTVVLPYMTRGATKLADLARKLAENWPKISATISRDAGKIKAKLSPLIQFLSTHRKTVLEFAGAFTGLALALKTIHKVGKLTGIEQAGKHISSLAKLGAANGTKSRPYYVRVLSGGAGGGGRSGGSGALNAVGAIARRSGIVAAGIGVEESIRQHSLQKGIDAADPSNILNLLGIPSLHQVGKRYSGKKGWGNLFSDLGLIGGGAPPGPSSVTPSFQNGIPILSNSAAVRQANGITGQDNPAAQAILHGRPLVVHSHVTSVVKLPNGKELARTVTHASNKARALK